jgi:cytoskeleton protein RodZ
MGFAGRGEGRDRGNHRGVQNMPPLDTGLTAHTLRLVDPLIDRAEPTPAAYPNIGSYLRAVREYRGSTLPELAAATRIRRAYLASIEASEYAALPSRPFAIGYVRAYANALEVDGEAAAERYKLESPDTSEPLRAPIGVKHERPERRPLILAIAGMVIVAVVGWNIVQRALSVEKEQTPPAVPSAPAAVEEAPAPQGPIALGAPTPPPAEQTTPTPYVTPGLGNQTANGTSSSAAPSTQLNPTTTPGPSAMAPAVFTPKGMVYGSNAPGPAVVLQARKPASLIVRGPAAEVYFARQLAAGEAYRAPIGQKLTAEVTDPSGFSVYINNQLRGALLVQQTPLDKVAAEIVNHSPAE